MFFHSLPSSARVRVALLGLLGQLVAPACAPSAEPAAQSLLSAPLGSVAPPSSALSASLRAAYLQARQQEAGAAYFVQPRGAALIADNAEHRLTATLDAAGVHLKHSAARSQGSLRLVRAGCAEHPQSVAAVAPRSQGARVEYVRPGLTEWYLNGPMGLEQGFSVASDAGCTRLVLELQLGGDLQAQLVGSGDLSRIELQDPTSGQRIYYSDLFARDARGAELPTTLSLDEKIIRLQVETTGAHYPIEIDPMLWGEQQKLISSDGAAGDQFGFAVAIDGNTAVIGAAQKKIGTSTQQGQAYVYVRSGTTWTEQQILVASDGAAGDRFGIAVAVSGNTAVIGASQKKVGANTLQGQAYVFVRSGTTWTEQQKLTASDAAAQDGFGVAVGISGDTTVVGAAQKKVGANTQQGEAYIYLRTGTTWAEQKKLIASDGAAGDTFASAVAVSGDTAIVSSPNKKVGGNVTQGQAYAYIRVGTNWAEQQKLISSDGVSPDHFGNSVALSGDTALIGAFNKKVGNNLNQGQAYVYFRIGNVWLEQQKLVAADGLDNDNFGAAVGVSGDIAVIGASSKTVNGQVVQGQAYVYVRTGSTWGEQQRLVASDGAIQDQFGIAVAVSGETAIVGAFQKGISGRALQGQAYAFLRTLYSNGDPCALNNECASGFCVASICCDAACTTGVCDTGHCRLFADLGLTAAGSPTRGVDPASFSIQLDNAGPNPADNIRVVITLPENAPLISAGGAGWSCTLTDLQVTCTLPTAAVGLQSPIQLLIQAPYGEPTITVSAAVSSDNPDAVPSNNSTTATITNDNPVTARYLGGGLGGCSTSGTRSGAAGPVTLLVLSLLALRRRHRRQTA